MDGKNDRFFELLRSNVIIPIIIPI